jgi:hypothetical protein
LEGKEPELGKNSIDKLLEALDNFKIPDRDLSTEPLFSAEHVYNIQGTYFLY